MKRGGFLQPTDALAPSSGLPFPQCSIEALAQIAKHVRLSGIGAGRNRAAMQNQEWQTLLDTDVFCVSHDRRSSRLNYFQQFSLLNVFAQFFSEKSEDANKCAYFDVIFMGRDGDSYLRKIRVDFLFKFASYSLQYPVVQIFIQISQWLSKASKDHSNASELIKILVDHYVKQPKDRRMWEFLLPIETACPEFSVTFMCHASQYAEMDSYLACVCGSFLSKNSSYALNVFRDDDFLAHRFASEVFPSLLKYFLNNIATDPPSVACMFHGIVSVIHKWYSKVKGIELDIEYLFSPDVQWSRERIEILAYISRLDMNSSGAQKIIEKAANVQIPLHFRRTFSKIRGCHS